MAAFGGQEMHLEEREVFHYMFFGSVFAMCMYYLYQEKKKKTYLQNKPVTMSPDNYKV